MGEQTLREGQGWARFGLGFGVALSITGNVAATALTSSGVSLGLRVPFAVVWPLALFIAVEILVRVRWRRSFLHVIGRIILIGPTSAVAAIVSWLHLNHLMQMAGETGVARILGPLAVDGLLLGSTVALLAIRSLLHAEPEGATDGSVIKAGLTTFAESIGQPLNGWQKHATEQTFAGAEAGERKTRAPKESLEKAVRMLLDGNTLEEAVAATGVGASTLRRYAKAMRELRANPAMEIDPAAAKLNPELLATVRAWANEESVR